MRFPAATVVLVVFSLATADAVADKPLGRLFTTPAQRAALEAADPLPQAPRGEALPVVIRKADSTLEYTGFIRTPAGARRWINGRPGDVTARSDAELQVPATSRPVKVGQQVNMRTGEVSEQWRARGGG